MPMLDSKQLSPIKNELILLTGTITEKETTKSRIRISNIGRDKKGKTEVGTEIKSRTIKIQNETMNRNQWK